MELTYIVQRSARRRKLTITVERDRSVVVHAPEGVSDEKIQHVVESKRQWIYKKIGHPQKYQDLPHAPGKELVSGESALYLGRQYRIEMVKVYPGFSSPSVSLFLLHMEKLQIYSTKEDRAWSNQPLWKCLLERLRSRML
jgi:predicted metal-dependent hydrolase